MEITNGKKNLIFKDASTFEIGRLLHYIKVLKIN